MAVRRHLPLLRAAAELLNAANGVRPIAREGYITFRCSRSAGRPARCRRRVSRRVDARRGAPWSARRLPRYAWPNRSGAHGDRVGAAVVDPAPQRGDRSSISRSRCARRSATTTRQSPPSRSPHDAARRSACAPNELVRRRYVEKADTVQYGPHPSVNSADIWRRRDLPRDGKAPVLLQVPGGAWAIGMRRPQAYPLMSHLAERGLGLRVHRLPRQPAAHLARPHRRRQTGAGLGQGEHRRLRRRPRFHRDQPAVRRAVICAALAALTPNDPQCQPGFEDADTSVVAAVPIYGRYDWVRTEGPGRKEFVAFLQKFVVKKPIAEHSRSTSTRPR